MDKKIVLTGIKPTGRPHLGNYLGAIKPIIQLAEEFPTRLFIADYHSLNTVRNPTELREMSYEMAATLLACDLEVKDTLLYCQSDIPQIFELTLLLGAFSSKGLLNRAHAYKAQVDRNREEKKPDDDGINMGLFTYPILMAADILLFDADLIPVGKDQVQHVEMASDMAQAVNHNYSQNLLKLPQAKIQESVGTVIGLDGRKMSKSYHNVIPMFCSSKELKKLCNKIVTNSQGVEEAKDPLSCHVFSLYRHFSTKEEQESLAARYREGGMGWGEAKATLFEAIEREMGEKRKKFNDLMEQRESLDKILDEGAERAREIGAKKIRSLREAIGIRRP